MEKGGVWDVCNKCFGCLYHKECKIVIVQVGGVEGSRNLTGGLVGPAEGSWNTGGRYVGRVWRGGSAVSCLWWVLIKIDQY